MQNYLCWCGVLSSSNAGRGFLEEIPFWSNVVLSAVHSVTIPHAHLPGLTHISLRSRLSIRIEMYRNVLVCFMSLVRRFGQKRLLND